MVYKILKQLYPGNPLIWVLKIDETDTIYQYDTLEDAEIGKENIQVNYPNRELRIKQYEE